MSLFKETEEYIKNIINSLDMEIDNVLFIPCARKELGEYQINCCMSLAKKYHDNPINIANKIVEKFDDRFINVNIAGPGFINVSFNKEVLIKNAKDSYDNIDINVDNASNKTIVVDYGGANACKSLHVGHMRSANIGEALKRLALAFGNNVIGDWHIGDLGRQAGMLITQLELEQPNLPWFDKDYTGEYPSLDLTIDDLGRMYPIANTIAKEDEARMEKVREATALVEKGDKAYVDLWKKMLEISEQELKKIYKNLNCTFDTFNGEFNSLDYLEKLITIVKPYLIESDGAKIIDVKEEDDKLEYPPLMVIKSNGGTVYSTRDLCSIVQRVEDHNPSEFWYVADKRQEMDFKLVFRGSYKTHLVRDDVKLKFFGFGTINGSDGKPYKTRDGGVMTLKEFIDIIKNKISEKISPDIKENKEEIINNLSIATLKFADLSTNRSTDYIFDIDKFCSFEGKTGPYILYTLVRIKSLINKININEDYYITKTNEEIDDFLVKLVDLPNVLNNSYNTGTLNLICDYLFNICNIFNKFYNNHNILNEQDNTLKESYYGYMLINKKIIEYLLNILAINPVERM